MLIALHIPRVNVTALSRCGWRQKLHSSLGDIIISFVVGSGFQGNPFELYRVKLQFITSKATVLPSMWDASLSVAVLVTKSSSEWLPT